MEGATSETATDDVPSDSATDILLSPHTYEGAHLDDEARRLMRATIDWFETRGKAALKEADHERTFYRDFLNFQAGERAFAKLLTPARDGSGDEDKRWDTSRIAAMNEILGFYGLAYWYTWQVSILGLGPIWQSENEGARRRAAELLDEGAIFAFGLSEKEHGADIYSTDMVLTVTEDGWVANGPKYYIGNGNEARMVSVFGRIDGIDGPEGYVFFAADSQHSRYRLVKNIVNSQNYVSNFELDDYPVSEEDVLHTGPAAFDAALNTVNVGKFNLGFGSIGICTHALYEAITHADNRVLYGMRVTDFDHVQKGFTDAYARLVAMKLFATRAVDYMRSATPEDRRYLLFDPLTKMKVTTEGERVVDELWDIIAAKGFEKDMYFEMAARDIRALPKLEGTVHVNLALILKFMPAYLFMAEDLDAPERRHDTGDDEFLFRQGPARGLGKIRFQDWRVAYKAFEGVANVDRFVECAESFVELLQTAPPDEAQQKDLDYLLSLGELFTLIPYGQLICEEARFRGIPNDIVDQVFDVFVRDFSSRAVDLHGRASSTDAQQEWALGAVRKPVVDADRFESVWSRVRGLSGAYEMHE